MDYRRKKHAVYLLTYHIVLVTKYRRPVITDGIGDTLKNYARYLIERSGGELVQAETDRDHMHLLVSMPPDISPVDLVRTLKTHMSKELHRNPEHMEHISKYLYGDASFWSASYFIATTGSVSMETVKEYIAAQRTDEHKRKYTWRGKKKGG